jgi:hypothetical protein
MNRKTGAAPSTGHQNKNSERETSFFRRTSNWRSSGSFDFCLAEVSRWKVVETMTSFHLFGYGTIVYCLSFISLKHGATFSPHHPQSAGTCKTLPPTHIRRQRQKQKFKPRKQRERKTSSRTQICDQEILSSIFFIIALPRNSNKETMAESGAATEW